MGGMSVSFIASEDFFVEYNYLTASISLSSFEKKDSSTIYTKEEGRNFRHYDLLLGYNLFQSEFFTDQRKSLLSNLYLVLGAGDTKFGTEDNFTYTWGVGYRTQVTEKFFQKATFTVLPNFRAL
jgi:outer membrane beta-barrel protein